MQLTAKQQQQIFMHLKL